MPINDAVAGPEPQQCEPLAAYIVQNAYIRAAIEYIEAEEKYVRHEITEEERKEASARLETACQALTKFWQGIDKGKTK